jgi:hypothetical protein
MNRLIVLGFSVSLSLSAGDPAFAKEAPRGSSDSYPNVVAVLDYSKEGSKGQQEGDDAAADALFRDLDRYDGKVISLKLSIIPKQDRENPGYTLTRIGDSGGEQSKHDDSAPIVCGVTVGDGTVGIVDNFTAIHRLIFQHTQHFHAPTEITIGDRARFPFQAIICTSENYLDKPLTKLVISGHFVVATATIPTANSYLLFPFPGQ